MTTVHIHCIRERARRQNRPDMIGRYKELATLWQGDICELTDYDHAQLIAMWDERPTPTKKRTCGNCRGL